MIIMVVNYLRRCCRRRRRLFLFLRVAQVGIEERQVQHVLRRIQEYRRVRRKIVSEAIVQTPAENRELRVAVDADRHAGGNRERGT